ncbi:hypothetical protein ABEY96_27600 [Priestia aryabhattai]|uniref:hypothetical protein n=1 Tax=Priestia aryabhattai TaxID=412384 RepID=UPI003D27ADC5
MNNVENEVFIFKPFDEHQIKEEVRFVLYDMVNKCFSRMESIHPLGELKFLRKEFESHMQYKFKYQTKDNGRWRDRTKYKYLPLERETEDGLKYIYYHVNCSPYLIVIFQALNEKPDYNYIGTLADFPVSRLYIKDDYGTKPTKATYYLGQNKSFDIATKVNKLIEEVRIHNNLNKKDVICVGSSKGGYAAIYHSFLGSFGYCIAGGPQVFLGEYLGKNLSNHSSVLTPIFKYLTGSLEEKDKQWANQIIPDLLERKVHEIKYNSPTTFIHVGKDEPHYKEHVLPFYNMVKEKGITNVYLDLGDYESHKELAKHYPVYLRKSISKIINQKLVED